MSDGSYIELARWMVEDYDITALNIDGVSPVPLDDRPAI